MADFWKDGVLVTEYFHEQCMSHRWLEDSTCSNPSVLGVAVRQSNHEYAFKPVSIEESFKTAARSIGLPIAFSMSSNITSTVLSQVPPYQTSVTAQTRGTSIPILDSLASVPARASEIKHSTGCLVRKEGILLVWANSVESAINCGSTIEQMLMETIWGSSFGSARTMSRPGTIIKAKNSIYRSSTSELPSMPRKPSPVLLTARDKRLVSSDAKEIEIEMDEIDYDPEAKSSKFARRPMLLTHSFMMGLAVIILFAVIAIIVQKLVIGLRYDGKYIRLALLAVTPIFAGFAGASAIAIVNSVFQMFAPIGDTMGNSRFHSAVAPNPAKFVDVELPHITIQIPVFKEGLRGVIAPTVASVRAAIKHYESVGGSASIYINDDGMQVIAPELAEARMAYYADHKVGWCARPPHQQGVFLRKGRFKKASNLNYGLHFSARIEDELVRLVEQRHSEESEATEIPTLTREEENELYQQAFDTVLASDEGKTMAAGNVRIGEHILIIDCDTRVPVNCLHMAALEMLESPEVAIIQHTSGVLAVAHNVFETGISFLTDLIYCSVRFNVASGDCAVFVGHNAFLRWKAVQSVAFNEDGIVKFWSESHVSEDWHLSLRLQIEGFHLRLATYHGENFKEGVSLTIYDEIARWEKYSYGCNELVFNPLIRWYKGPITSLYLRYLMSNVKTSSKLMVLSYTFSYYAIASALPLTLANYMFIGLMPNTLDRFYVSSWKVFVVIVMVFNILTPISYCVVRFRLGQQRLLDSIRQIVFTLPLVLLYFGGLSFHLLKAILCHFFGVNIEWTSTAKELESSSFFVGIDRIFTDFASMYIIIFLITGGMIYLGNFATVGWLITNWTAILPLANQVVCHFLVPIILAF